MTRRAVQFHLVRHRHIGFTLLETLGVVTLMAFVAAVATQGLSGATNDSRRRAAIAAVRDIDAKARLLSASGPVELVVTDNRGEFIVRRGTEQLFRQELPDRCNAHLLLSGPDRSEGPVAAIKFTFRGASPDYRIYLEFPNGSVAINIAGLTGWIETRESAP